MIQKVHKEMAEGVAYVYPRSVSEVADQMAGICCNTVHWKELN